VVAVEESLVARRRAECLHGHATGVRVTHAVVLIDAVATTARVRRRVLHTAQHVHKLMSLGGLDRAPAARVNSGIAGRRVVGVRQIRLVVPVQLGDPTVKGCISPHEILAIAAQQSNGLQLGDSIAE